MTQTAVTPQGAVDLLPVVELTSVRTYALAGRRVPGGEVDVDVEPEVGILLGPTQIEVRMRIEVGSGDAVLESDMAAVYELARPVNLWAPVLYEFVERVAVMAIYPFVRESIFATASRMNVAPPVLGLMRAGDFSIGKPTGPAFAPSKVPATLAELAREFGIPAETIGEIARALQITVPDSKRRKLAGEDVASIRRAFYEPQRTSLPGDGGGAEGG